MCSTYHTAITTDIYFINIKWHGYFYFADTISGVPSIKEPDKNHRDEIYLSPRFGKFFQ